jgi:hypothetical protein
MGPTIFLMIDPTLMEWPMMGHTLTDLIDKILTSTPRLLAVRNFLLALTYLLQTVAADWFLGSGSSSSSTTNNGSTSFSQRNNGIDEMFNINNNINNINNNHHHAIMEHGREKMGGFFWYSSCS